MNTNYVYPSAQVGEFRTALLYGSGPSSYSQTTGDVLSNPGANEYINFPCGCLTVSGNYEVRFQPAAAGLNIIRAGAASPSQSGWTARWFYTPTPSGVTGATFTAGSGYPNGTYVLAGNSGSAAITVVISGNAITSAYVSNPGSGYSTLPTFALTPIQGMSAVAFTAGSAGSPTTAGTFTVNANSGNAQVSVTIGSSGIISAASIVTQGTGYSSAPSFTTGLTAIGATGSVTPTVGSGAAVAGTGLGPTAEQQVGAGTNLSAETIQFMALVSSL